MKWKDFYNYYLSYSIIVALALLALGIFVIYPAFHKILIIKTEINQEKDRLEKKLSMGLNAKKIKEELEAVESSLPELDKTLIKKGDELLILTTIEDLAAKNKIILNTVKPDFNGQTIGSGIYKTSIEINAAGNFNDLLLFLNSLDSSAFYLVTDQLTLNKNNDLVGLTLTGWLYFKSI